MSQTSLEAVAIRLKEIRQNPKYKRNFPKRIWEDIFELVRENSLSKVCDRLKLDQGYVLKKLGGQNLLTNSKELKFQEVFVPPQKEETVVIELFHSNMRARVEGPISCVRVLKDLLGEG